MQLDVVCLEKLCQLKFDPNPTTKLAKMRIPQNAKFQLDIQILQISTLVTFWFLVLVLYILGLNNCLHRGGIRKCLPPLDSCTGVKTSPLSAIFESLPNHLEYKADGLSKKFSMDSPIQQVLLIR